MLRSVWLNYNPGKLLYKTFQNLTLKSVLENINNLIKQPVFKNILLVASISLLVKGLGFFKESIVAGEFGLSQQLDTFYIAMLIPGFITTVFFGSFKSVFIPNYISELRTGNDMSSFQTMGFIVVLGVSTIFLTFAVLVTDVYLKNFFAGHTAEYYHSVKVQFYFLAPCIIIWGLSTLLSGLLNINNEFKYSSLDSIFLPIAIIICIFFFRNQMGKVVLAGATLIGSCFNFIFLLTVCWRKKIISFGKPDFKNKNAILMFKQVPAKATSGFLTGMLGVTDQYFSAQLAIGSIAALNYGNKIPAFLTGLLVVAMSNVLLPYFSKKVAENREKAFNELFKLLKWLFIVTSLVTIVVIFMSDYLVQICFQRREFSHHDTVIVSMVQKIILIYTPFSICGMVLVNFLTSINKNAFMAWMAMGGMILNIILDYLGVTFYGIYGITIATTTIYILRSLVLFKFTLNQKRALSLSREI
jgi:putative peptidoglycan lipid II flippase